MATFSDYGQSSLMTYPDTSAIVEASDIPILSSTDRLQRALLRWVDICGLSGQFMSDIDIVEAMEMHDFLDDRSYLVEMGGADPHYWSILWAGESVTLDVHRDFHEAMIQAIPDERFVDLVAQEYADATRYRRASARRFAHRNGSYDDTMDQLIFPLRNAQRSEFVLIVGEAVTGRTLYMSNAEFSNEDAQS